MAHLLIFLLSSVWRFVPFLTEHSGILLTGSVLIFARLIIMRITRRECAWRLVRNLLLCLVNYLKEYAFRDVRRASMLTTRPERAVRAVLLVLMLTTSPWNVSHTVLQSRCSMDKILQTSAFIGAGPIETCTLITSPELASTTALQIHLPIIITPIELVSRLALLITMQWMGHGDARQVVRPILSLTHLCGSVWLCVLSIRFTMEIQMIIFVSRSVQLARLETLWLSSAYLILDLFLIALRNIMGILLQCYVCKFALKSIICMETHTSKNANQVAVTIYWPITPQWGAFKSAPSILAILLI